jgi:hypothetical protein
MIKKPYGLVPEILWFALRFNVAGCRIINLSLEPASSLEISLLP